MPNNQKGFTLVELLIAVVIISVGILAWARAQNSGIKNRAVSNDITTASELAIAKVEELALENQSNPDNQPMTSDPTITLHGINFSRQWKIDSVELQNGISGMIPSFKLYVKVSWDHYGSKYVEYQRMVVGE